ncbi:NAD(P)H-dependent flavin oxidoreductase [Pseudarthrobacter enclensis]|uniref:Nitronate monooxygenase/enoyl-[acyl-carrier protein] reductase II n=1 Tax=Pseudarthrobacter enclensis TaxID=993070 RepID=A0ABT9RY36_9MICC|nr:nitronate monooxygenase [Pseudarthrobacter enclensis]MDP9890166.1 nitronate monooxygenase/enoyl-[acyl-carrier protein] reductase II [Pseudarthrobacter enclensis]
MLRTTFCEVLGVEHPIVQAGMGPFGSGAELAAAVSNAGALGSLGGAARSPGDLREQLSVLRTLTERPFAVNFTQPWLQQHPESFDIALELHAPVVSLALGDPGELPARAHEAGALFIQQVHTVEQAYLVAGRGVDVIIAQGAEAGGFGGMVSTVVLVPQVVDAVGPVPVLAAGGIADGRGLAAALVLGAQGVNIGTRFLASEEATISGEWKQAILAAGSQNAVKVDVWDDIFGKPGGGAFDVVPRALETPFIEQWQDHRADASAEAARLQSQIMEAVRKQSMERFVPFTGQSVGMIGEVLPARDIVQRLIEQATEALQNTSRLFG